MIGRLLAASALALSGLAMVGAPAHACSCVPLDTAREAASATHVFVGTVTGSHDRPREQVHDIDVSEVYKGEVPEVVELHSVTGAGSCGLGSLPAGRRIAFFATATRSGLVSDSCSGTAPVTAEVAEDLSAELGDPAALNGSAEQASADQTEEGDASESGGDGAPLWPALTALLLLAVGAGLWTARRTT